MKLLTFLGIGPYSETTYFWQDKSCASKYAPVASCQFLQPDSITVFLTEEVEQQMYPDFCESLPSTLPIEPVHIPMGGNQQELWQIFYQVSKAVKPDEEVAFDITHGFRLFPLLGLLVAAFMRSGLGVSLEHVFYGAYDAREPKNPPHRTPIFDLTPMLDLLEWSGAADQFTQTGDARRLANLLAQNKHSSAANKAIDTLKEVSLAAFLCQPLKLAEKAPTLESDLLKAQAELDKTDLPFNLLRQRVVDTFVGFSTDIRKDFQKGLHDQYKLILWYYENRQLSQAMTLAREWMINAVLFRLNEPFSLNRDLREYSVARAITAIERSRRTVQHEKDTEIDQSQQYAKRICDVFPTTDVDELVKLTSGLQLVRNALAHAGHQEGMMSVRKIENKAEGEVIAPLGNLAKAWGLS